MIRHWSAESGHPIEDLTAEDDFTPLPGWAPGAKTSSDDGRVAEERVLHPALTMVPRHLLPTAPAELFHQRNRPIPRGRPRAVARDVRRLGRWDGALAFSGSSVSTSCSSSSVQTPTTMQSSCWTSLDCRYPLAQRDLAEFFEGLAKDNQLLYTCHSPFLVDADRLDRARKVYVDGTGTSRVTSDLREGDAGQRGAAYAVFAAVGLSVAESLLLGCDAVAVEGPSDQHYMMAIKNLLIGAGRLKAGRELVFPPAAGAKGVRAVSSILGGRDEVLPVALFDSDSEGRETIKSLRQSLYAGEPDLVLEVGPFAGDMANAEIEDILPAEILIERLDRWQRAADVPFADEYKPGSPIVPQIEAWAQRNGITLPKPGWKPELAKRVK